MLHNLTAFYYHLTAGEKQDLERIPRTASKLAKVPLQPLESTINSRIKSKCLRLVATDTSDPAMTLDKLPSGRYRTLRTRVKIRQHCFRNVAVKVLNSLFFEK